jgi:hypothetical protein
MFTRLRHGIRANRGNAIWMSATAVLFVGLYRAACTVLVDASGNFVNDLLNSWVGRIGEWVVLGGVMAAYAVHLRRQSCAHCAVATRGAPLGARRIRTGPAPRACVERLPAPTRRPARGIRRTAMRRRARFA